MATLASDEIGTLNMSLNQGDNKSVSLIFKTVNNLNVEVPIDLREYSAIRLDVKSKKDVNEAPFISFAVGSGLVIEGEFFNILSFEFKREFVKSQSTSWYYDIKFTKETGVQHFVEGQITVKNLTTK